MEVSACECSAEGPGRGVPGMGGGVTRGASWEAEKISDQGHLAAQRMGLCCHRGQSPESPMTDMGHLCDCSGTQQAGG